MFKSENQLRKTKPKMIPWSKRKKNIWFRQCLWEELQTLSLRTLPAFFGVKQPQEAKQHEKRLSQMTCSNKPRHFSKGPGHRRPPSVVLPWNFEGFLSYKQQGHPCWFLILMRFALSERTASTGTIIDWTNIPDDVICALRSWPATCSWLLCSWFWLRIIGGKMWLLL